MSSSTSSATEIVRRTFLRVDTATVLSAVDSLDLRGAGKISAVIGVPLRNLQLRRDVSAFAQGAPVAALKALLELLAMVPLEKVIEALGDHADNPSFDQLAGAVDQLLGAGTSDDEVVMLLAFAIAEGLPAAPHCRRLLSERANFELPVLPDVVATSSLISPKQIDPQVREQRRVRREEEKKRKKGPSSVRPPRPVKNKPSQKTGSTPAPGVEDATPVEVMSERRKIVLTPLELDHFNPEHPLCGSVVLVEVPFDAVDPETPELKSKERPALVVAASTDGLLVRAIYSNPSPTRSTLQSWRRLGFDHLSYIDDVRVALSDVSIDAVKRLGSLTDQEWNAQF
jgi:hypothetical protein